MQLHYCETPFVKEKVRLFADFFVESTISDTVFGGDIQLILWNGLICFF